MNLHPLQNLVHEHKNGMRKGICSVCSANEYVIEAAVSRAADAGTFVLIEATANQVDQFGGYTGMKPVHFRHFVHGIADRLHFPLERVILGGDHLGPLTWKSEPAEKAMRKAEELVRQYAAAGFTKIHLDTSMHLGDDPQDSPPDVHVVAERAARLCRVAESAARLCQAAESAARLCQAEESASMQVVHNTNDAASGTLSSPSIVYVVGSEVPVPGGSHEEEKGGIRVTRPEDFETTVDVFRKVFADRGLQSAWERVIAVVVQPGVEFGDETVHPYDRLEAADLCSALKRHPQLAFEGHSTDYQTASCLRQMVEDGILILKVGPQLTFALREALFALNLMEMALFSGNDQAEPSCFMKTLEEAMLRNPGNWEKHYHGGEAKKKFARKYSFSDRCRYYLPDPAVQASMKRLMSNLQQGSIPLSLISQFMPIQYGKIRNGLLANDPEALLKDSVVSVQDAYYAACGL